MVCRSTGLIRSGATDESDLMESKPVAEPGQSDPATPSSAPPTIADRSRLAPVLSVVGLLALVAIASAANPVSIPLPPGRTDRLELFRTVAVIAVAGVLVALAITFVLRTIITRHRGVPPERLAVRALPVTAAAIAACSLLMIASVQLDTSPLPYIVRVITAPGGPPPSLFGITDGRSPPVVEGGGEIGALDTIYVEGARRRSGAAPYARAVLRYTLLAVMLAMLALWLHSRMRRARPHADDDDGAAADEATVHDALVDTIDAMLDDPDPATAIIGAYARLIENLDACGLGRLHHEGPMEHLRRVLTRARVHPEPLRRLIELFELARFSTWPLRASHREQALAALHAAAADVALITPADGPLPHAGAAT